MANRNIQVKIAKLRKQRRSRPKAFSSKNSGPYKHAGFLTEVVGEDGEVKRSFQPLSIASRSKAAQSIPNWSTMNRWIIETFKYDSTEAIYARTSGLHTDIKVIQDEDIVLAKQHQSKEGAGSLQGESRYVFSILIKNPSHERRVYISGDSIFFIEEKVTKTHIVYRISHEYDNAEYAMQDHKNERILWDKKELRPLPNADSPNTT